MPPRSGWPPAASTVRSEDICDTVYATTGYQASIKTFAQFKQLSDDGIFGDSTNQTAAVTGDVTNGYLVTFDYGVDASTPVTGDGMSGGRRQGGS